MTQEISHSTQTPLCLVKITMEYIPKEDRVRLLGTDAEGTLVRLWLTARLLKRLVPHLISIQDSLLASTKPAINAEVASSAGARDLMADGCESRCLEALITTISFRPQVDGFAMLLNGSMGDPSASFLLTADTLLKWNTGLCNCFERAGWDREAFLSKNDVRAFGNSDAVIVH